MDTKRYTHKTLPISAPALYWQALGYIVYSNTDEVSHSSSLMLFAVQEMILIGMAETQSADERALVWALKELQRRREVKDQVTAITQLAQALNTLRVPADLDVRPVERAVDKLIIAFDASRVRQWRPQPYQGHNA